MSSKKTLDVKGLTKGGPYSHAVIHGNTVYVSGMTGHDPERDTPFPDQFRNAISKVSKVLSEAGTSLDKALKVTVYLSDPRFFDEMNSLFKEYFGSSPPARTTVVCSFPNSKVKVELDVIAGL
jgi:2-iminobutanoate/2-iminopropanoate deaminase